MSCFAIRVPQTFELPGHVINSERSVGWGGGGQISVGSGGEICSAQLWRALLKTKLETD